MARRTLVFLFFLASFEFPGSDARRAKKVTHTLHPVFEMLEAADGSPEAAQRLKAVLAVPDAVKAEDKALHSPLNMAAFYGSTTAVRLLIDAGADVNHADRSGHRPLHHVAHFKYTPGDEAAEKKALEIAKILLDSGADPSAKDNGGLTASDWGKKFEKKAFVQFLGSAVPRTHIS